MSFKEALKGLADQSLGLFGLADHGTELDTSQSDRLMMTSTGNTTSITQRAVAPKTMGVSMSEKFRSALDLPASKETVAEKGYVVALGDWTTSQEAGTQLQEIHVPKIFMSSDYAIFGLLNYHEYIRCGVDVTVQINPTEWQIGGLIVWIESCQDTKAQLLTNYNNLLTYTADILNCNVNNEVRLKQAFTFSRNLYELHATSNQPEDIFCIRIAVWSKLKVASGTSTKVSYKVTASLCDVEMHGMRVKAQMMRSVGYVPSKQMAIGPGIGALNMSNMSEMHVNSHMTMGCEGFEMDSTFAGGVEAKDLQHHLTTPCRFNHIIWSTTKTAGIQLAKYKVHPRQPPNDYSTWPSTGKQSSNISLLSSLFRYWRGDLVFVFQVFASKWHSGRLMLAFTPGMKELITDSTSLKVVSTCSAAQYDIHGPQSTFVYRVPYISSTQYLDCDPSKAFMGWLYVYIYTQMAAPNNVSTEVEIICYICGAKNFELFVPSYNAVQMGPENPKPADSKAKPSGGDKAKPVQDVAATAIVSHGSDNLQPKVYKESPMGAMEMPQYKPSEAGTFPELKDGTRLHKKKHTDLDVLMGRAHFWTSFMYSSAQGWLNDQALNWSKLKGFLEAMSKCFTLFRGGLKVVVTFETLFQAEVWLCFRPKGVEPLTTLEQMYKYGMVSFSTEQTHQVVLKLPWYQPIAANSIFSEFDAHFGYLTIGAQTSGSVKVHLAVAFDEDSKFYTPRGCPTDAHFRMGTVNPLFRSGRSLPDATAETKMTKIGIEQGEDEYDSPSDFHPTLLRSSVHRKGMFVRRRRSLESMPEPPRKEPPPVITAFDKALRRVVGLQKPQMSTMKGHYLCKRPSPKYPVDHYFILLDDGTQWGFQSANGEMFGRGMVSQEFNEDYEIVEAASEIAVVARLMEGPFYRDYHFVTYNCEHWARAYCGLPEKSTQTNKLMKFLGWATVPVAAAAIGAMHPQAGPEQDKVDMLRSFITDCTQLYWTKASEGATTLSVTQAVELAAKTFKEAYDACGEKPPTDFYKNTYDSYSTQLCAKTQAKDDAKATTTKKPGLFDKTLGKFVKSATDKASERLTENVDSIRKKTQNQVEDWIKTSVMPSLEARGAKVCKKVLNIIIDVAQAACLLHVAVSYPVPGVIGPIALAATLGAIRGASRLIMRLTTAAEQTPQMFDEMDVTDDMASMLYECVVSHIPTEMEPQAAKAGFIEKVRSMNIVASGVRNMVTLAQWVANCVKACVEYILPGERSKCLRKLDQMKMQLALVRQIHLTTKSNLAKLTDANLLDLSNVTMKLWRYAIGAKDLLKDRTLVRTLSIIYTEFTTEMSRRELQGDGLPRVEPIVIWFHGPKGSGKSLASMAAASMICKRLGLDPRKQIYTKPVSAKYFDGYKQQAIMVMDDVGQNTSATSTDYDDFCQLVSTAPLRLNMAHLDDKGVQFKTPIIVASSNIGNPEPPGIADTDAIRRRIADHRYHVAVKDTWARKVPGQSSISQASVVLDANKANTDGALKTMRCCDFTKGLVGATSNNGLSTTTMDQIVDSAMSCLDAKTQTHKSIMDAWFDWVEQSAKDPLDQTNTHEEKTLKEIALSLEIDPVSVGEKVIPLWTRVLLGLAVAATMVAGVAGVGCAVWGMAGMRAATKQGAYNATPNKPMIIKVPAQPVSATQAMTETIALVRGNLVSVGMRNGERIIYKVQGLFVRELQMLLPRHFMTSKGKHPLIINSRHAEFEYEHSSLTITEVKWGDKETDAVLVTLPSGGATPYKDIVKHFVKADNVHSLEGSCGVLITNGTYGETFVPEENLEFFSETTYGVEVRYNPAGVLIGKGMTMDGMCGGGLVSAINKLQNPILGIHVAGNGCMATTQVVTQEMLAQREQSARVVGITSCTNLGMSPKTKFKLSPLARYFSSGKMPAVLGPSLTAEQDVFAMALAKYNVPVVSCPYDWGAFEEAFTAHFINVFGSTKQGLTVTEAINGIEGLDSINMQTSPGYPWVKMGMRKKDLFKWDGEKWRATEMMDEAVRYHIAEVQEDVAGYNDLSAGIGNIAIQARWDPPIKYVTYYKDELRPIAKVYAGKTRIIEAAPVHHVVAFRAIFGSAMAMLHQSSLWRGFAPGSDIEMQAKYLYRKMQKYPWIFDADYAGFDGSLQPFVMLSAMRVLGRMAGIDPVTSQRWARLLIRSNHMFGETEIKVFGSMPSGSPATTIINTISNMMMTYYAISKVTRMPCPQVFRHNLVVAYGDDLLIMSDDPELAHNMQQWVTIQKEVFAATVTSPAKDGPPRPTSWDQVVFLKRTLVVRRNDVFACLDKTSIEAMFEWQHESETFSQRVLSALRHAANWGREYYGDICARLTFARMVSGIDVGVVPSFESFELATIAKLASN